MFENKKIFILGIGKSGLAACKLLSGNNEITITDIKDISEDIKDELKDVNLVITNNAESLLDNTYDVMIKNPGIRYDNKAVVKAKELGIPVINEVELAYHYLPSTHIIAVTGSNGKTTTVTLIYEMLKREYANTFIGGNIGTPLSTLVNDVKENDYLVLEISDHQLVDMYDFKSETSVLLNIYDAHTDFHGSHEKYVNTKKKIFNNQNSNNYSIINKNNEECFDLSKNLNTNVVYFSKSNNALCYINNDYIYYDNKEFIALKDIRLRGSHNYENIMASIIVAKHYNVSDDNIKYVLKNFGGVEHRIEFVRTINGVSYYNDAKSTNVEATKTALSSFKESTILILGGLDRGHSFEELKDYLGNTKFIMCYGETKERIKEFASSLNIPCECFEDLKTATMRAVKEAHNGDIVLLSPACASWDQYNCFEERGQEFKEIVRSI